MNYVVLDLEWNQGNAAGEEETEEGLLFEIIEIGAVKLNGTGVDMGRFSCLVRPSVYHEMNQTICQLVHLEMGELEEGSPFPEAMDRFLQWCGAEPYLFCTWSPMDLTELQRNMKFHNLTPLSEGPIAFFDVQKLFSLAYEDGRSRRALEYAADFLELEKSIPFHRALGDAFYTAEILKRIIAERPRVLKNVSYDVFHPPASREAEVKAQFDTYTKYISRVFESKQEAFADREVLSSRCYLCHRNLRKKLKWFSANGRHYYCLAYCEEHGYLKGKIRVRRAEDGKIFIVKTTKLISEEAAQTVKERRLHARELHRRHRKAKGL